MPRYWCTVLPLFLWNHLVKPLMAEGICLNLPNIRILHSGGWKRLQDQAVEKTVFNEQLARLFGCSPDRIIDFYGMVESVGVIFPDCPEGNKHGPVFGDVIVRNPLTLEPVAAGEHGIVQVCSVLPTSFPGNLLLTEDMAKVIAYDGCPCGRRGISFRFAGRIPKAELRGCGNLETKRSATDLNDNSYCHDEARAGCSFAGRDLRCSGQLASGEFRTRKSHRMR